MRALGPVLRDAWSLASPYFKSEERWTGRLLLGSIIAMNLFLVGLNVVLNYWNGAFFDSLQNKDWPTFLSLLLTYRSGPAGFMPGFVPIVVVYIPVAIYRTYINQLLQIRWRRWMTQRLLVEWLSDRAFYTMGLIAGPGSTDNPDQRISDDMRSFVEDTLTLGLGLLSNVVSMVNFAIILWGLSGALNVFGVQIPGYLLIVAVLYAAFGSWLTHLIGRPLARLEFGQQKAEADFRFGLARLRENTEGVALLGGEGVERAGLEHRFGAIVANWILLIRRRKLVNALIFGYEQVAGIFPIVVASPRYFAGEITLGGLTRVSGAFSRVQGSLSWFIEQYQSLAGWRATVARLVGFREAVQAARVIAQAGPVQRTGTGPELAAHDLSLLLPDGSKLLDGASLRFAPGQSTVISGRSGSGKSTLFRALAGVWPFGSGVVEHPPARALSLPQRPYIPLGTLRHALAYPAAEDSLPDTAMRQALQDVGLGGLADQLGDDEPWPQRLSGGEQQRLAIARALLLRPDWLFMDEATASLDPEAEAELYGMLRRQLPDTTIISIAHRTAVADFHDQALVFHRTPGSPGQLLPSPSSSGSAPE